MGGMEKAYKSANTPHKSVYKGVRWYNLIVLDEETRPDLLVCRCDCGKTIEISKEQFKTGRVKSCGCGRSVPMDTEASLEKLWKLASNMIGRHKQSESSKATVCPEWRESKIFFVDWAMRNGYKPGATLEKIDKERGLEPSNCRWAEKQKPHDTNVYNVYREWNPEWAEDNHSTIRVKIGSKIEPGDAVAIRDTGDREYKLREAWDEIPLNDLTDVEISKYFLEV